jgi:hypothetical protein
MSVLFSFLLVVYNGSHFSISSPALLIFHLFYIRPSDWNEVISPSGFGLHFADN